MRFMMNPKKYAVLQFLYDEAEGTFGTPFQCENVSDFNDQSKQSYDVMIKRLGMIDNPLEKEYSRTHKQLKAIQSVMKDLEDEGYIRCPHTGFIGREFPPVALTLQGQESIEKQSQPIQDVVNKLDIPPVALTLQGQVAIEKQSQPIQDAVNKLDIHPEIQKHCGKLLSDKHYSPAIFEASKGLAQRIRTMVKDLCDTSIDEDGVRLIDYAFSEKEQRLRINNFSSETEKSKHRGLISLLKGCFYSIRNPGAHEPIESEPWSDIETIDALFFLSMLHRQLDKCEKHMSKTIGRQT